MRRKSLRELGLVTNFPPITKDLIDQSASHDKALLFGHSQCFGSNLEFLIKAFEFIGDGAMKQYVVKPNLILLPIEPIGRLVFGLGRRSA